MRRYPQLAEQPLDAPTRSLAWRYALALLTVAALSIGGQLVIQNSLQHEAARADVINLAGRQRLLAERLGKTALQLHGPAARERLADTLAALQRADATLQASAAAGHDLLLRCLTVRMQAQLAGLTAAARALEASPSAAGAAALVEQQERFVARMDAVVGRHARAASEHVARLRRTELTILAAVLLTLLLEGLLVFWPALRRIRRAIAALLASGRERAAILAALPEPVVLLTRDGQIQDSLVPPTASPAALEHLGAFLRGPHAAAALQHLAEVREGDRIHALDIGPGPSDRRFELRMSRYHGDTVLALMHDVTEQRLLDRRMLDEVARAQQRMGSELHDGLCQQLTGLLLLAQALEGAARRGEAVALADLTQLREHLAASAVEVRQVSQSLYPVVLREHGLVDALRQLCDSVGALHRVRCTCNTTLDRVALEGAAIHLYRIAQEAVANAVRHARCTTIAVSLEREGAALVLTIVDDGVGLPAAPAIRPGMGLHSMSHRAEAIGAWLTITPRPGGGTQVRCALDEAPADAAGGDAA